MCRTDQFYSQPSYQTNCWQSTFLLKLKKIKILTFLYVVTCDKNYLFLGSICIFLLSQCCVYVLVR